jgi:hypothetical protein
MNLGCNGKGVPTQPKEWRLGQPLKSKSTAGKPSFLDRSAQEAAAWAAAEI